MPITLRLTEREQEAIAHKTKTINRKLVDAGKPALKESEVAHLLLWNALHSSDIDEDGDVFFLKSSPKVETKVQYY